MDSTHFPLTHGMTIYNNVVAIYNWWQDEVFGVEIYNQQVAEFQRFTFETFWKMAESRPEKHIHKKKVQQY